MKIKKRTVFEEMCTNDKPKEYIEREALLKKNMYGNTAPITHRSYAEMLIQSAPAADVVEAVRKPVNGYEGYYEVDQFGRVYSVDRIISVEDNSRVYDKLLKGKQMKQSVHTKGYKIVSLTKDGKTKTVFVHRIVAKAFIPNAEKLTMVNHKDEDKTNNFAENLEWCTAAYNRTYGRAVEKQAKALRGKTHTEEHKRKISESMKKHYKDNDYCSHGERKEE